MTVEEFIDWHHDQSDTEHYELVDGRPVAMVGERLVHAEAKLRAANALNAGVRGTACRAYVDGPLVRVTPFQAHQPDVVLRCGPPLPGDTVVITDPLIVVEVLSPRTARSDLARKLEGYFAIESVRHYLVVDLDTRRIIHFRRDATDQPILTVFVAEGGTVRLDPPGLTLAAADVLPELEMPSEEG